MSKSATNPMGRKNPFLQEAIDGLNRYFELCAGDRQACFASLTSEENEFILQETEHCIRDTRYYLENYHVVRTESEGLKTLYPMWDSQEMFIAEVVTIQIEGRPVKCICLKARQLGISTVIQGLVFHKTVFTEACTCLVVAQDIKQSSHLYGMSRLAYDNLPWWLQPEVRYNDKDTQLTFDRVDEVQRVMNPGLKSEIMCECANKMTGVSVGRTVRSLHASELSLWPDGGVLATQILPAVNAPDTLAFLESTARGRKGFWPEFWKKAEAGKVPWQPIFIPWFKVKKYSLPFRTVAERQIFHLTEEEVGIKKRIKSDTKVTISDERFNWRRMKIEEFIALEGDEWKFFQEFPSNPEEAFQGSGLCAFPKRLLYEIRNTQCRRPAWTGDKEKSPRVKFIGNVLEEGQHVPLAETDGNRLRIWEWPDSSEKYYIGADVAHGLVGGDYSVAQVIKLGQGMAPDEQVAEWHGWINPTPFAYILAALGEAYNKCEVAVEVNDVGIDTNNVLFRNLEYDNVYRWKHIDVVKHSITNKFGWYTNYKSRGLIISRAREAMMDRSIILRSDDLLEEMIDFSSEEQGDKFEGQSGNDDRVMAILITNYCPHEIDYGENSRSVPKVSNTEEEVYHVIDREGRSVMQTSDHLAAVAEMGKHLGWSMKTKRKRRDFYNTEFAPDFQGSKTHGEDVSRYKPPTEMPEISTVSEQKTHFDADMAAHGGNSWRSM